MMMYMIMYIIDDVHYVHEKHTRVAGWYLQTDNPDPRSQILSV